MITTFCKHFFHCRYADLSIIHSTRRYV